LEPDAKEKRGERKPKTQKGQKGIQRRALLSNLSRRRLWGLVMPRLSALLAFFLFSGVGCSGVESEAKAGTLTEYPIVGAVTPTTAKIHVRTASIEVVAIEYADNKNFRNSLLTPAVTTIASNDYTAQFSLSGLSANTVYWYRVRYGSMVQSTAYVMKFSTFPTSGAFTFAVFADVAPTDRAAAAYGNANDDGAQFALQIGDFDHGNPSTLAEMRLMHRRMRDNTTLHGADFTQQIASKMPVVHVWDDHDYGGNDTDKNFSGRANAWQAFDEYWPGYARPNSGAGLWHSFTVADAEFFVLDLRSQRDPGADTDNASKSMLDGDLITDDQKDWLKAGLAASTKTWKFIVSSVTMNATARPASTDHWGSYQTELIELAYFIANAEIDGVIVLTGDLHTGGALDDGTNSGLGFPELCVPHTNLLVGNTANLGTWSEGATEGARGYGLVEVGSSGVILSAVGANGVPRHSLFVAAP
jgi:alkaline phosphatase D